MPEPVIEVRIDPAMEGGVYANALSVMYSGHEMTLDFAVTLPAELRTGEEEHEVLPMRVTARVRVAPTVVFDLMRTLETNLTAFEKQFGEVRRYDMGPLFPPETEGDDA